MKSRRILSINCVYPKNPLESQRDTICVETYSNQKPKTQRGDISVAFDKIFTHPHGNPKLTPMVSMESVRRVRIRINYRYVFYRRILALEEVPICFQGY